jgi:hypothetical protein
MLHSIILVLLAYLTDGTPVHSSFTLPAEHACNEEVALDYMRKFVAPNGSFQDTVSYVCLPAYTEAPGPAYVPMHIPQDDEA